MLGRLDIAGIRQHCNGERTKPYIVFIGIA